MVAWLNGVPIGVPPVAPVASIAPVAPAPPLASGYNLPPPFVLIEGGGYYLPGPTTELHTVPKEIRRALAVFAVEELAAIHLADGDPDWKKPDIDHVVAWTYRHPARAFRLRRRRSGL
jgi:hypothetical protein